MHKIFLKKYLRNIGPHELEKLANQYNIAINEQEMKEILPFIHNNSELLVDIKNKDYLIKQASLQLTPSTFERAQSLLEQFENLAS